MAIACRVQACIGQKREAAFGCDIKVNLQCMRRAGNTSSVLSADTQLDTKQRLCSSGIQASLDVLEAGIAQFQ
ncbi:hypothetical protein D3C76_1856390 [compost metagenome]